MSRLFVLLLLFCVGLAACEPAEAPAPEAPAADVTPEATAAPAAPTAKANLNTATAAQFRAAIPGLSDRMVHEFEEYRPYVSIQQFRREMAKYVDEATIAGYEQAVFVPIDYNESDAATLMQIPGVDQAEADALIAQRPFASREAFTRAAAPYADIDLNAIAVYLGAP